MNNKMDEQRRKRRESQILILFAFLLVFVICISKFALGINFGLLEKGYQSFGYKEIKGADFWALSFGSFAGEVRCTGTLIDPASRKIRIHSGPDSSEMMLDIDCDGAHIRLPLDQLAIETEIPGHAADFELRLSGKSTTIDSFNAVWNE